MNINTDHLVEERIKRVKSIASAGSLEEALVQETLPQRITLTLSESVVLGLLKQDVRRYVVVLGHGSTDFGEVLRVYEAAGLIKTFAVHHETEAAHSATALRWICDEKAAVVTSIGPGALQALAGSLVSASNGKGVWYIFGEETTEDEGPNMQQIPKNEQGLFLRLCQAMGNAYTLHTPAAVSTALRRGMLTVDHPFQAGPFFLLLPMNTQGSVIQDFNLRELPASTQVRLPAAAGDYIQAAQELLAADRAVVKIGGGAASSGPELEELVELADAALVTTPRASGVVNYNNPRNMTVGGAKGTLCGNYAMENADLLITVGTRPVCQGDCSRTGYPKVQKVIAINADLEAAEHYSNAIPLVGDAARTIRKLNEALKSAGAGADKGPSDWFTACTIMKKRWEEFKAARYQSPVLYDDYFNREVLTQPAAIKTALDWAGEFGATAIFDAGDVQANGFQIAEDKTPETMVTDTGASYMGFAASSLLSTVLASREKKFYGLALSGDGSFLMNPQILVDGAEHGATGCILLLDNSRMGAISSLQLAQYGRDYATSADAAVDYIRIAQSIAGIEAFHGGYSTNELRDALDKAGKHTGLSLVYVPVYYGADPLGGMGVFGRWNVGPWCRDMQELRHRIGL